MHKDILFLGSQSPSRKALLEQAGFTVKLLPHSSDEQLAPGELERDCAAGVVAIAQAKMQALDTRIFLLQRDEQAESSYYYVVTADTLTRDPRTGEIFGKPYDRQEADRMLDREQYVEVLTGCCVRKYTLKDNQLIIIHEKSWVTKTSIEFYVPPAYRDFYFSQMPQALFACGAGVVEGAGFLFLKSVNGCFSSVVGIPMFELRQVLEEMGFSF